MRVGSLRALLFNGRPSLKRDREDPSLCNPAALLLVGTNPRCRELDLFLLFKRLQCLLHSMNPASDTEDDSSLASSSFPCLLLFDLLPAKPDEWRIIRKRTLQSFHYLPMNLFEAGQLCILLLAVRTLVFKWLSTFLGRQEKEYEMILRRTLQSICLMTVHPNTTTSIIVQAIGDDGALLSCAINASCAALVDAGIPLKHLAVAICCGLTAGGHVILDPTVREEQKMKAVLHLVFPNPLLSIHYKTETPMKDESIEQGIISSVGHGAMSVSDYDRCLERGSAACTKISEFLRRSFQSQSQEKAV